MQVYNTTGLGLHSWNACPASAPVTTGHMPPRCGCRAGRRHHLDRLRRLGLLQGCGQVGRHLLGPAKPYLLSNHGVHAFTAVLSHRGGPDACPAGSSMLRCSRAGLCWWGSTPLTPSESTPSAAATWQTSWCDPAGLGAPNRVCTLQEHSVSWYQVGLQKGRPQCFPVPARPAGACHA